MAVGLQLAGKNDFVKVQENINNNLTKLDEAIDFNLLATLGIEYGGILNNTGAKVAGKAYYDTTGKKLYKCIANTSVNYADASYFEALSNNDLLGRLDTLKAIKIQSGFVNTSAIAIGSFQEIYIEFPEPFSKEPSVVCSIGTHASKSSASTTNDRQEVQVYIPTTVGFYVRWYNISQSTSNGRRIQWVATA